MITHTIYIYNQNVTLAGRVAHFDPWSDPDACGDYTKHEGTEDELIADARDTLQSPCRGSNDLYRRRVARSILGHFGVKWHTEEEIRDALAEECDTFYDDELAAGVTVAVEANGETYGLTTDGKSIEEVRDAIENDSLFFLTIRKEA